MRLRNPHEVGNSLLYGADRQWNERCREEEEDMEPEPGEADES